MWSIRNWGDKMTSSWTGKIFLPLLYFTSYKAANSFNREWVILSTFHNRSKFSVVYVSHQLWSPQLSVVFDHIWPIYIRTQSYKLNLNSNNLNTFSPFISLKVLPANFMHLNRSYAFYVKIWKSFTARAASHHSWRGFSLNRNHRGADFSN